jgi:hypothetical protein
VAQLLKEIGTTKIGKQVPKPSFTYPTVRLPLDRAEIIGKTATLYETEYCGNLAFLIVVGKKGEQPVIQPQEIVAQTQFEQSFEKRIIELEKRIGAMEGRGYASNTDLSSERSAFQWARRDSNTRSSPCEGDVIAN